MLIHGLNLNKNIASIEWLILAMILIIVISFLCIYCIFLTQRRILLCISTNNFFVLYGFHFSFL